MNAIKYLRTKMHFTQEQLAQCLGISRVMFTHCETGRKTISTDALIRISKLEIMLCALEKQDKDPGEDDMIFNKQQIKLTTNHHPRLHVHAARTEKMSNEYLAMRTKHAILKRQILATEQMPASAGTTDEKEILFLKMLQVHTGTLFQKSMKKSSWCSGRRYSVK